MYSMHARGRRRLVWNFWQRHMREQGQLYEQQRGFSCGGIRNARSRAEMGAIENHWAH